MDRFHLALDHVERVPGLEVGAACTKQEFRDRLLDHRPDMREHGEDQLEIRDERWNRSPLG